MIKLNTVALCAALILLFAGCSSEESAETSQTSDSQSAPAAPGGTAPPTGGLTGNSGRVVSTLEVPGYSYIEVETSGRTTWLAGNPVKVEVGDTITWSPSTVMQNFHSKSLERTFAEVIFVDSINEPAGGGMTTGAGGLPAAHPPTFQQAAAPTAGPSTQGSVVSVQNAANYSYLEIKTAGDKVIWVAAPETPVNVNDTISWQGGSMMSNFTSSSLGKTFPEIYFVTSVQVNN